MTNTASASSFNSCGYTALPGPVTSSSVPPFTTTDATNGEVLRCPSSTYFNFAVNTQAECAGGSTVISTISSIHTSYESSQSVASASRASEASVSSASAASASSAAAVPSGACKLWDAGLYYLIQVYDINAWGGDGSSLHHEEDGCGGLTGWEWHGDCDGGTSQAWFNLDFFIKAGCVERAIHSAGGPEGLQCEGMGDTLFGVDGETQCHEDLTLDVQNKAVVNNKVASNSVSSITTTHVLAVPGNTAAAAARASSSGPASVSATATAVQ